MIMIWLLRNNKMKIHIEYCIKWNYGPEFDRVSKIIKGIKPNCTIVGNEAPPRSGAFEVTIDNKLIFSKFSTGDFPNKETINNWFK